MKSKFIILSLLTSIFSFAQVETYCSNPAPVNGVGVSTPIVFSSTNMPVSDGKYYTTAALTTSGEVTVSSNKFYSATSISFTNGFKATTSSSKFTAGVGSCTSVSARQIENNENNYSEKAITLFPNPAIDEVNIDWKNYSISTIYIYSYDGKKIFEKDTSSLKNYVYDVKHLSQGIYNVIFQTNEGFLSKKLIIM